MSTDSSVATVALIVSLIALFIALTQLLQQIFGTAEGYRRCQETIIGPWSTTRKRKIRWNELRMETQFMTPEFSLLEDGDQRTRTSLVYQFRGHSVKGLVPSRSRLRKGQVGWLNLMASLQDLEQNHDSFSAGRPSIMHGKQLLSCRRRPVFVAQLQTWDLMPPDVVRPLATTTLGNILVIAHRLGMDWTVVRPSEGLLHAERQGQSFSAIEIRSLGLAVRYTDKDPQHEKFEDYFRAPTAEFEGSRSLSRLFIPSESADKMAFGFIPADPILGTEEYCLREGDRKYEGLTDTLTQLGVSWNATEYCTRGRAGQRFFGDEWKVYNTPAWNAICDAVYLLPPWLPLLDSGASRVRLPMRSDHRTPFGWREGHVVFWLRLKQLVADPATSSPQLTKVFAHMNTLATRYPDNFIHIDNLPHRYKSHYDSAITTIKGLQDLQGMYEEAVSFLKARPFPYTMLVASHIDMAADVHKRVQAMPEKQWRTCDELASFHYAWMVEQTHQYIENLEHVEKAMNRKGKAAGFQAWQPDDIRDAWWTMVLKGIVWKFSVQPHGALSWDPYSPIPSHFWDNDMPIYIM